MFTGIAEEKGTVVALGGSLKIAAQRVLSDIRIGDSIAVNGVCLTVTAFGRDFFTADAMPETYRYSALGSLKIGSRVHLEKAVAAGGRFGGHIVSGHIDGTAEVMGYKSEGNAVWMGLKPPLGLMRYIAPKGSVAVDGISLTAAEVLKDRFFVSLIPHTASVTTLADRKPGDMVNIETDILAKYVERLLGRDKEESSLSLEFLESCGF